MKSALTTAALAIFLAASPLAHAAPGALDGKTFKGKITQEGEKKGDADNLVFKDGKVTSTACVQYGFKDGDYTTTAEGEVTKFEADIPGEDGVKMHWSGTVKGATVDATATRIMKDGKSDKSFFTGKLAAAKAESKKAKKAN